MWQIVITKDKSGVVVDVAVAAADKTSRKQTEKVLAAIEPVLVAKTR